MRKASAILSLALLISSCSHTSVYEVVAREVATIYVNGNLAYHAIWRPIGSAVTAELTAEEQQALKAAISTCIEGLKARVEPVTQRWEPDKVLATAEFVSCMRDKSWFLTVEDIIVG